jgi:ribosomal protein S18 acetylase RimI-like enzyme
VLTWRRVSDRSEQDEEPKQEVEVRVRRLHRRDLNRAWEFLKHVFRDVNRETVEYQRPRSKTRFFEVYDEDEVEQLLFETGSEIVGYAECTVEITGSDNWLNPRYFEKRGMRPMFVDELAVHAKMQGRGVGGFMLEQLQHLARSRGCTHLVLEVAENNREALAFYKHRNFQRLDAAIFMAQKIASEPELLPPRRLKNRPETTEPARNSIRVELPVAIARAAESAAPTRRRKKSGKPPATRARVARNKAPGNAEEPRKGASPRD